MVLCTLGKRSTSCVPSLILPETKRHPILVLYSSVVLEIETHSLMLRVPSVTSELSLFTHWMYFYYYRSLYKTLDFIMTFPYMHVLWWHKPPLLRLPQGAEEVLSDSVLFTWAWPPQGLQYLRPWEWEVFPGQGQKSVQAGPRTDVRDAWPLAIRSVRRNY